MKKIFSFLLAAAMLTVLFAIPCAADEPVNPKLDIEFSKAEPVIDGSIKAGEYVSKFPVHNFNGNSPEIKDYQQHNQNNDWDYDFYICWTEKGLYMAWEVHSETFGPLPERYYDNSGFMWEYSCVQFVLTPGAPKKGVTKYTPPAGAWSGNYLEVGLAQREDGESCKVAWSFPDGCEKLQLTDWDAVILRDEKAKKTTYEVYLPWNKTGIEKVGNGAQFGLSYAVAAQEFYGDEGERPGVKGTPMMLEWPDSVLGGCDPDSAAVITLKGNKDIEITENTVDAGVPEGKIPSDFNAEKNKVRLDILKVNSKIEGNDSVLVTDPKKAKEYNLKWSQNLLLKPVEGKAGEYEVVENAAGAGDTPAFAEKAEKGMLIYAAHSNDENDGSPEAARKLAAAAVEVGSHVKLFGVKDGKLEYSNAMIYVVAPAPSDVSGDTSDTSAEESKPEEESKEEESKEESKAEESKEGSNAEESKEEDTEKEPGFPVWAWIVIAAAAVIVIVIVIVAVSRKKKAK